MSTEDEIIDSVVEGLFPLFQETDDEAALASKVRARLQELSDCFKVDAALVEFRQVLATAEEKLREVKILPPRKRWTNLDEAKSWVRNALSYGNSNMEPRHKVPTLLANLVKIQRLLEQPNDPNHEGPHK